MSEEKLIRVSYGMTVNLGNYESERYDCSLQLPLEEEFEVQFFQMFRKVKMKVMDEAGKFGAKQEALNPDLEYKDDPRLKDAPKIVVKESKEITIDVKYTRISETGKAYLLYWVNKGKDIWLPKKLVNDMNKFIEKADIVQTILVPTSIMEGK